MTQGKTRACAIAYHFAMHYALDLRTFLFSHYFYTGLRVAVGVIGLTLLAMGVSGLQIAMTVSIGALCASLMDLPSPLRHKFNEMLASVLLCSAVTLLISLCTHVYWLLALTLLAVTFLASMMVVYGRKTLPLQFAALFAMTLSMENQLGVAEAFLHAAVFLGGGLAYVAYAMAIAWMLRRRTKQQVLAEALFSLARYVAIKADIYDIHVNLSDQFNLLVRQQILLAEKQQASRDLILRGGRNEPDAALLRVHFGMLDLYELILTTHTDYALLRSQFADDDILNDLRTLVTRIAEDLESIAYAVTRKLPSVAGVDYRPALQAIEADLQAVARRAASDRAYGEALAALRGSYNKMRAAIAMIGDMHRATQKSDGPLPVMPGVDMTPFLTQQKYELRLLLSHLRRDSPIFRFSLRVVMAVATGLAAAELLPYSSHGYWIVLTIVIILKPSFSMTKQRRGDRLIGTVIGCVLTALILHFFHSPLALLGFLFLASVAVPSFVIIKYRYTAVAATMQILLQLNLLLPGTAGLISERLIDTLIGAVIATAFSFVLPSWEFRSLPRLVQAVLRANQLYVEASRDLLQGRTNDDFAYRLSRKRFMDSLAGLSSALGRMLDEPVSKQYSVGDINQFITQNYLVVAHVAAIRLLLRNHPESLEQGDIGNRLQAAFDQVGSMLAKAQSAAGEFGPGSEAAVAANRTNHAAEPAPALLNEEERWSGSGLLQRRIALLHADARGIAVSSMAIKQVLRQV